VATTSVGFAVSDEDRARLDELVDYFGGGNRSAYLRATLTVMDSIRRAEVLRSLQARSNQRLAEQGIEVSDLDDLIRSSYKKRDR
jgi:hypothetical protein